MPAPPRPAGPSRALRRRMVEPLAPAAVDVRRPRRRLEPCALHRQRARRQLHPRRARVPWSRPASRSTATGRGRARVFLRYIGSYPLTEDNSVRSRRADHWSMRRSATKSPRPAAAPGHLQPVQRARPTTSPTSTNRACRASRPAAWPTCTSTRPSRAASGCRCRTGSDTCPALSRCRCGSCRCAWLRTAPRRRVPARASSGSPSRSAVTPAEKVTNTSLLSCMNRLAVSWRCSRVEHLLRLGRVDVGQQHDELLAAEARHRVARAQLLAHLRRQRSAAPRRRRHGRACR